MKKNTESQSSKSTKPEIWEKMQYNEKVLLKQEKIK